MFYNLKVMEKYKAICIVYILIILLWGCSYDAKRELKKDRVSKYVKEPKYLKVYLLTMIDTIKESLEDSNKNYAKLVSYIDAMYYNVKYTHFQSKELKSHLLERIKEIKKLLSTRAYNRVVFLKLEQLRSTVNKIS
jgi:uncharacterized protein YcbK (DUF882 family)